jgi:hypothetical protein
MQAVAFDHEIARTRQVILWAVLLQVALLITGSLIYLLGGKPLLSLVEIASSLALVLYCLALAFLWFLYLRQPEVKEKYRLRALLKQNEKESGAARAETASALKQAQLVRSEAQAERDKHQVLFDANLAALEERIKELRQAEIDDLEAALVQLQNAHLAAGLKAVPFDHTLVPGIGEMLGEKLSENGILTAFDVTLKAVKRTPGIGESKATSLVWWRESLESSIKETQPVELPQEARQAITSRHASAIGAQADEKNALIQTHEKWLEEIRVKEAQELAETAQREADARARLTELESRRAELQEQIKSYRGITFTNLLSTALSQPGASWLRRIRSGLLLVLLAAGGTLNFLILLAALVERGR